MENQSCLVVGRPGVGKSTYIENAVFDAIEERGRAIFVIDPHGETVMRIADALPRRLIKHTAIIDPSERGYAVGFNPLRVPVPLQMSGYQSIWEDSWGPQLNYLLKYALLALYEHPTATLADVVPLFTDPIRRAGILEHVRNPNTLRFWTRTFPREYAKSRKEPYLSVINKIDAIASDDNLPRILCQKHPKLDLREVLANKGIVLVNLAHDITGDDGTAILGSIFTSSLRAAVLEINGPLIKAHKAPHKAALFADEFSMYGMSPYAKILTQLRKYGLNRVVIGTQYVAQIPPPLRTAILATVAHKVIFNVEPEDAELLARSYDRSTPGASQFNITNITELAPFEAYISGVKENMPQFAPLYGTGKLEDVLERSRRRFARKI